MRTCTLNYGECVGWNRAGLWNRYRGGGCFLVWICVLYWGFYYILESQPVELEACHEVAHDTDPQGAESTDTTWRCGQSGRYPSGFT